MGLSDVGYARGYVWDVNTLQWVKMQQPVLEAGDITVGGSVSVSNMIPAVETGLAKDSTLTGGTLRGAVSVSNAGGGSAVNIQDGGNSITVDGSVSAAISGSISNTAFGVTGDVAVTNSATAGKTKLLTTPDNPSNLDVALSTRLKPADTLTKVSTVDTITNSVAVTNSGLSNIPTDPAKESGHLATIDTSTATTATASANLDVALSTRLKPADTLTKVSTVDTITNPVTVSGVALDATLTGGSVKVQCLVAPTIIQALIALQAEMRLLRQAFQDWSGARPRFDPSVDITSSFFN